MKIVHVIPGFTKGGAERVAVDLANAAVEKGDSVAVIAAFHAPENLLQHDLRKEVEVRFVAKSADSARHTYLQLVPWLIRNRAWVLSHDIVHCHLTFGAVFGTLAKLLGAASGRRTPLIVETYHAVGMPIPKLHRRIHSVLMRGRDAVALMAEDPYWERWLRDQPLPTAVIPNGVRGSIVHPTMGEVRAFGVSNGIPEGAKVVGTVGRLVPARRPDLLLQAFANAARTEANLHFIMAGDGPNRAAIEAQIDRHGLRGRVHMAGLVMEPALAFSVIDLYLTLNVGPITGLAALEAATFGIPVIALQLRDDYPPRVADWIWSTNDVGRLAERIIELIRAPEERVAIAERQMQHVASCCTVDAMAEAYRALYAVASHAAATRRD